MPTNPIYFNQSATDEHDNDEPKTKKVSVYGWDSSNLAKRRIAVNSDGELKVNLEAGDIEIGAVEVKDGTTDRRAVVDSDGVNVSVKASVLPAGASTSAKQDSTITELQVINSLVPARYDYISLSYTDGNLTGVVFKTGGSGGTTVSTLTLAYTGANLTSVTKS